ncbi:MAG: fumarate reductase iron-sulfur subunit [Epsilonproteobacteria bacterium]|nr:fumarate reductase iron-sulfur subunit [Campylobacterota bacterium]
MSDKKARDLDIRILKFNPHDSNSRPTMVKYQIKERPGMSLFLALSTIREKLDHDLAFDFVCRAGICGSCGMLVNGKPMLSCKTQTKDYKEGKITLMPMPAFELIKDLSVNTGKWMNGMSQRVGSWIHTSESTDIGKVERRIDPEVAYETFELDRCIECGICIASCATKIMRPDFVGAVGLNRVVRFATDPYDERRDGDFYELIGDDNGIFGCMSLMGCEDHCPKELPLQEKIAYMRRKMVNQRTT